MTNSNGEVRLVPVLISVVYILTAASGNNVGLSVTDSCWARVNALTLKSARRTKVQRVLMPKCDPRGEGLRIIDAKHTFIEKCLVLFKRYILPKQVM